MTDQRAPSVRELAPGERGALDRAIHAAVADKDAGWYDEREIIWKAAREYERCAALATAPAEPPLRELVKAHAKFCDNATRENADELSRAFVAANAYLNDKGPEAPSVDPARIDHKRAGPESPSDDEMARGNVSSAQRFLEIAERRLRKPLGGLLFAKDNDGELRLDLDRADEICIERREAAAALAKQDDIARTLERRITHAERQLVNAKSEIARLSAPVPRYGGCNRCGQQVVCGACGSPWHPVEIDDDTAAPVPEQKWAPLLDPPDEERALYDAAEYVETGGMPSPDQHMRLCKTALRLATAAAPVPAREWQPIASAPKTGPCKTILLYVPTLHGTGGPVLAHWAFGGGDEQPPITPDWYYWNGYSFSFLREKPTHWMPLPPPPAAE